MTNIIIISILLFMTDFDLGPHDWLLKKIVALGMELRAFVWITNSFWVRQRESESEDNYQRKLRVMSGVLQGSVLGPLLFLVHVNHIWKNTESTFRLFVEDCVIYRKIVNNSDVEKLQTDLGRLGEWAVENG